MSDDGLLERAVGLCQQAEGHVRGPLRDVVARASADLAAPLRVALVGKVKAGKSTLLNALIGRKVAPTSASECTQVVTWYRFGPADRAAVRLTDGSRRPLQFEPDGSLPSTMGVPSGQVRDIEVTLSAAYLGQMTLIDTPGLASANTSISRRTDSVLGIDAASHDAAARADALVYVYGESVRQTDVEALNAFRAVSEGLSASALNAIAVLTQVDRLTPEDGTDPWTAGARLAAAHQRALGGLVAKVIPVSGLLGQTAVADLRETDARSLRRIAAADRGVRRVMLLSEGRWNDPRYSDLASAEDRRRLFRLLGGAGLALALGAVAESPVPVGAADLAQTVLSASRLADVTASLTSLFGSRAGLLKARRALSDLVGAADDGEDEWLGREAERLLLLVDHRLEELRALARLTSGEVDLPDGLQADAVRLLSPGAVRERLGLAVGADEELAARARLAARQWRERGQGWADPQRRWLAEVLTRCAHHLSKVPVETEGRS